MDEKLLYPKGGAVMRTRTKAWLIAAGSLVVIGCILFAGVMATLGWDFVKLSTVSYETNSHAIDEPFHAVSLTSDTADVVFAPAADGKCRVECYEEENARHAVAVEADTLVIQRIDTRSWYDRIGIYFGSPRVTVYLPKAEYTALTVHESTGSVNIPQDLAFASAAISLSTGDVDFGASAAGAVRIQTSTGNIRVAGTAVGSLELSVTTGKVTVSDVTCRGNMTVGVSTGKASLTAVSCDSVISSGTTGSLSLERVIAANTVSIKRSTGDVRFSGCDAAELSVKTSTGSVTGSLLTDKVLITDTRTGRVNVPQTTSGGRCEIRTNTGDIQIEIE